MIRLPTAAREPVRNPPIYSSAPRLMCEASGFLRAMSAAMHARPDLPRWAFVATAHVETSQRGVDGLDIIEHAARLASGRAA